MTAVGTELDFCLAQYVFPTRPSCAGLCPKNVSLFHQLLFLFPLFGSGTWLRSLSWLWALLGHCRQQAVDKSKQPEPHLAVPQFSALCFHSHIPSPPPQGAQSADPGHGALRSSWSPQRPLSPGSSSPFFAPLQHSHEEAVGEGLCRGSTEAALCSREGSESSAGPGWEGSHQPAAQKKSQHQTLSYSLPGSLSQTHLKAEPHFCSTACTTSSFSSWCREQVE